MTAGVRALVEEGRAALRAGDGASARRAFDSALAEAATGEVVEGLARAAYVELECPRSIELWERAFATFRDEGDQVGATRVARTLAYMHGAVMVYGNQEAMDAFVSITAGTVSPAEFFDPANVGRIMDAARPAMAS